MLQSFFIAVNAIVPFLSYLIIGFYASFKGAVDRPFLNKLNGMIFSLMFPFMTFYNIYNADLEDLPSLKLLVFIPASLLLLEAFLLVTVPLIVKENRRRGVIIQAIYRSNNLLLAIPIVLSIYGESAGAVTAMIVTIVITIYNITSVIILELFRSADLVNAEGGTGRVSFMDAALAKNIAVNVSKNPLLRGALLGIIFLALGIRLPSALDSAIKAFSDASTPLALFVLGGTLSFSSMRRNMIYLAPALFFKLFIIPAVFVYIGYSFLGLRSVELFLVLITYAAPVAVSSFPMAQSMGGDGELAGQFVVLSTVLSVFTLFMWIFVIDFLGLLF